MSDTQPYTCATAPAPCTQIPILDPWDVAALLGGSSRLAVTAIATLEARGALVLHDNDDPRVVWVDRTEAAAPEESAVLDVIAARGMVEVSTVLQDLREHPSLVSRLSALERRGLTEPARFPSAFTFAFAAFAGVVFFAMPLAPEPGISLLAPLFGGAFAGAACLAFAAVAFKRQQTTPLGQSALGQARARAADDPLLSIAFSDGAQTRIDPPRCG